MAPACGLRSAPILCSVARPGSATPSTLSCDKEQIIPRGEKRMNRASSARTSPRGRRGQAYTMIVDALMIPYLREQPVLRQELRNIRRQNNMPVNKVACDECECEKRKRERERVQERSDRVRSRTEMTSSCITEACNFPMNDCRQVRSIICLHRGPTQLTSGRLQKKKEQTHTHTRQPKKR